MEKTKKSVGKYFAHQVVGRPLVFAVMAALALFCLGSIIYFAAIGQYRDCLIAFTYMLVVPVFYVFEKLFKVESSFVYAAIVAVFTFFCFYGASYNFYTTFKNLDDVLHAVFGVVFAVAGFALIKALLGQPKTTKAFVAYLFFAFAFSLMIAVFWEIYEFIGDRISPDMDMQEDTIINSFNSFMLYPGYDHLHTLQIDGIAYTVLYDAEGNVLYTIEGGYLDIGIMDTMWDIIWCTVADIVFVSALAIDWCHGKRLYKILIPQTLESKEVMTVSEG